MVSLTSQDDLNEALSIEELQILKLTAEAIENPIKLVEKNSEVPNELEEVQ